MYNFFYQKAITLPDKKMVIMMSKIVEVMEISQDRFWELLEALPPEKWNGDKYKESFRFMERYSCTISMFCFRLQNRYFKLMLDHHIEQAELEKKVKNFIEKQDREDRVQYAYQCLVSMIENGIEYPNAENKIVDQYGLTEKECKQVVLRYDESGIDG